MSEFGHFVIAGFVLCAVGGVISGACRLSTVQSALVGLAFSVALTIGLSLLAERIA